ncbi:MAG TPA: LysR family transcriptional regulator [Noviherbaspirillum sp.]|uniref:LysR family transcriptional regulator n=1 Tax=Noviherbaspirillum sp. TaxID=1926288 RepID=UPI002D5FCB27|nr:LysR family transcriptional regulator [Noviherbaspirillum sp.]HYD96379.1 LysR family transcriptional regulator [Noviherbaspirillum sp.]
MGSFNQFLAFASAARRRSFAQAGRELGITASTVAKRIAQLERQLGVKLFHRTTRHVTLSSDGEALYARCEKILADIDELEALAAGASGEARGELRINVPITYGKRVVIPALARLMAAHPALSADLRLSDQFCDVVKDGMDAVIRIAPLEDSRLACRRIGWQHLLLCASPAYLARHGKPKHPGRLDGHAFLLFRNPSSGRERPLQFRVEDRTIDLHPPRRVLMDDGEALVQAACHDLGLTQVPDYMVAEELGNGTLVEVLARYRPPPLPISVIWPGSRLLPPRVRAFIDALATPGK